MKKIVLILNLVLTTLIFAQKPNESTLYEQEYYDLINYVPKNFEAETNNKAESPLLQSEFNTISSLRIYYELKDEFKFSDADKKWLENKIDNIATALFFEGKRILLSTVGGYSGCPDKMIDTIRLNKIEITDLKFCYSCTGNSSNGREFIRIFNTRMYSLMQIESPNSKTHSLYGEYKGIGKVNLGMKLILTNDREFKFWINKGHGSEFTQGIWKNKNGTLILNSKQLEESEKLTYSLSNGTWIDFNNFHWLIEKEKIESVENKKWKMKKVTEE